MFCLDEKDGLLLNNQVISVDTGKSNASIMETNGSFIFRLSSDSVEHLNTICVNELIIPVKPDCLDESVIGQCIDLDDIVKPVFVEKAETLGECYLRMVNFANSNDPEYTRDTIINTTGNYQIDIEPVNDELVNTHDMVIANAGVLGTIVIEITGEPTTWGEIIDAIDNLEDEDIIGGNIFDKQNMTESFEKYKEANGL